jgi:glyoxylase-like metal-dependent hydrolase (beta-lactamase superfamily II)
MVLTILTVSGALSIVIARPQQDATILRIEKVKDALYIVTGGRGPGEQAGVGGNTTVFITDAGVVLVDTKYPGHGKAILDQVKSVTTKPVTTIINTHTHGDHTGGNGEFPRTVDFVAHDNTKTNMARMDQFKGLFRRKPLRTRCRSSPGGIGSTCTTSAPVTPMATR